MLILLCGICANKTHMLKTETRDTKMYKTVVDAIDSCTGIPTLGMGGWMIDDLQFYVLFNSISVISGRCLDDNERLCAMELRLRLRRFHLE